MVDLFSMGLTNIWSIEYIWFGQVQVMHDDMIAMKGRKLYCRTWKASTQNEVILREIGWLSDLYEIFYTNG